MKKAALPKEPTFKTSISIPRSLHRAALKKSFADRRAFSNYIQALIEKDLRAA